jgi:hypothetical protein
MAFPVGHYDPNKTLQIATDWEAISLCLLANKANDSGAEACSGPNSGTAESQKSQSAKAKCDRWRRPRLSLWSNDALPTVQ